MSGTRFHTSGTLSSLTHSSLTSSSEFRSRGKVTGHSKPTQLVVRKRAHTVETAVPRHAAFGAIYDWIDHLVHRLRSLPQSSKTALPRLRRILDLKSLWRGNPPSVNNQPLGLVHLAALSCDHYLESDGEFRRHSAAVAGVAVRVWDLCMLYVQPRSVTSYCTTRSAD